MTKYSLISVETVRTGSGDRFNVVDFLVDELVDDLAVYAFQQELLRAIEDSPDCNLLLDFSRLTDVSSIVLGTIIHANAKVHRHGGRLRLCGLSPAFYACFVATDLARGFDIREDREDGLGPIEDSDDGPCHC